MRIIYRKASRKTGKYRVTSYTSQGACFNIEPDVIFQTEDPNKGIGAHASPEVSHVALITVKGHDSTLEAPREFIIKLTEAEIEMLCARMRSYRASQ